MISNTYSHIYLCEWCRISVNVRHQICSHHTQCSCCNLSIPTAVAAEEAHLPDPRCPHCQRTFCAFIRTPPDACRCRVSSCIASLEDFRTQTSLWHPPPLLGNTIESGFVRDYVEREGITVSDFLDTLFSRLDGLSRNLLNDGLISEVMADVLPDTRVCIPCRRECLSQLLLDWRVRLPPEEVRRLSPNRPNCYYGVHCRTQLSNLEHAKRFNHCCPQTKFN